jgi:anaerobic selenocysteine-containing dehydrogenase
VTKKKTSLEDQDLVTERAMSRRSSFAAVGAAVLGSAALVGGSVSKAEAQCTDRDPSDPPGRGRGCGTGCTDRDPSDRAGFGRFCGGGGCSDRDPSDPVGRGRHCGYRSCSDSDPTDPVGRGRHC